MQSFGFPPFPPNVYNEQPVPPYVRYDHWNYPPYAHQFRRVTIVEAMNIALEQVPGEVVKIELEREGGMLFYEVDILTMQGRKYEVIVNIDSGDIVSVQPD